MSRCAAVQRPLHSSTCASVQAVDLHGGSKAKARHRSRMNRASEHRVQLAALDQNAQAPNASPSPPLHPDAPARNVNRAVDNMAVDGAPGNQEQTAGLDPTAAVPGDHIHGAAAPPLYNNDIMLSMIQVVSPLMTMVEKLSRKPRDSPVDQLTMDNLRSVIKIIKPRCKELQKAAKHSRTDKAAAARASEEKPRQQGTFAQAESAPPQAFKGAQADNAAAKPPTGPRQARAEANATAASAEAGTGGRAKQHKAAVLPDRPAAMGPSALPVAGAEQAVVEAANRPPGPQDSLNPRLAQATSTLLQDPTPGEHAVTAANV